MLIPNKGKELFSALMLMVQWKLFNVLTEDLVVYIEAHGRLLEPPARNTLWRFGFKSPANYNDNELFCGGINGITRNEGKCGLCGDPYDGLRIHETGQMMALNQTTRNYFPGSTIDLMIEIVANHGGHFEFSMCWRDDWTTMETEDCFEPLKLSTKKPTEEALSGVAEAETTTSSPTTMESDHSAHRPEECNGTEATEGDLAPRNQEDEEEEEDGETNGELTSYNLEATDGAGIFTMSVELPAGRECTNCILRWHWRAANNWGRCKDNTEAVGCGPQEIYRNCADVSVKRLGNGIGLGLVKPRRRKRHLGLSWSK